MNEIEKRLKEIEASNPELKKLFEKEPEKRELYKQKLLDDLETQDIQKAYSPPVLHGCEDCAFRNKQFPDAIFCRIHKRKPDEVMEGNARCEFYEKEKH